MSRFFVEGPFDVPVRRVGFGRVVDTADLAALWGTVGFALEWSKGCYVFAVRAGKGIIPVYVGKATKSFRQECFALHKAHKLNTALLQHTKGRLILFLVPLEKKRGKPNAQAIGGLERFLIQNALARNDDLLNVQHTKPTENFEISGVFRAGKGKPSHAASAFKRTLGL